jgi:hypothetical protein
LSLPEQSCTRKQGLFVAPSSRAFGTLKRKRSEPESDRNERKLLFSERSAAVSVSCLRSN